jgi:hypothetical protein
LRTAIIIWSLAWPTVMVLSLLVGPDRRLQGLIVLGYIGGLLVFGILSWAVGTSALELGGVVVPGFFQPLILWLLHASPSLFLLLFLNRTIRTIGPLVLMFVFVLLVGTQIAISILAVPSVLDATANAGVVMGLDAYLLFAGVVGLGALALSWPAWRIVAFLRDRYAAKRSSELMLTIGAIWLLQAIVLASALFPTWGFCRCRRCSGAVRGLAGRSPHRTAACPGGGAQTSAVTPAAAARVRFRTALAAPARPPRHALAAHRQHRPDRSARSRLSHHRASDLPRICSRQAGKPVHSLGGAARRPHGRARSATPSRCALPHQSAVLL